MRGGDVADAGDPLCDAQLAGTRGHVTAILAAHVRDAGADPRLRRPARPASSPVPCPPYRASPSAHQSPIAPPLPRPLFRSLLYPIAGSRAEYDRKGERKGRYLLFRWVCAPTAHRRTPRLRGIRVPQGLVFDSQWFIPARAGKTRSRSRSMKNRRAHPRAGGENLWEDRIRALKHGSSPRGRGKRPVLAQLNRVVRLIPARAGKTSLGTTTAPDAAAHPRAGGENDPSSLSSTGLFGSSPRGRGKRHRLPDPHEGAGLIPARAGKTPCRARAHSCVSAHPRLGGENIDSWELPERHVGSSPRRRGKLVRSAGTSRADRLIPA